MALFLNIKAKYIVRNVIGFSKLRLPTRYFSNKMPLIIYKVDPSPPSRAALMVAEALGLSYETVDVNLLKLEHRTAEFKKKNPQQTIPVLEDNGKYIWDSHAIGIYLIEKYGTDDSLYPKDHAVKAQVNQRLHFDSGILFPRLRTITDSILIRNDTNIPQEKYDDIERAYDTLEKFLEEDYLAGGKPTLADICCVATTSSLHELMPVNAEKYPRIKAWIQRMSMKPYYQKWNSQGCAAFGKLMNTLLAKL